jgi:ABC-type phosphate transport system substrate-binding protein
LFGSPAVFAINVITNITADTASISTTQLRRIYTMRQSKWPNGTTIVVFVLPSKHPNHQKFCKDTLRLFPYQLDRIWNKLTFSGLGVSPIKVNSEIELIRAVQATSGAIGYVENVEAAGGVNVIKVDG